MAAPVNLAAIDAGSNAVRLLIARAVSPRQVHELAAERCAVRLGHRAFTLGRLDQKTLGRAAKAFRHLRELMRRYRVGKYRAVATAAAREARNRRELVRRIRRASGIRLEVISGAEEARLVRAAVLEALGGVVAPRLIVDLGGGSLEISLLRDTVVERSVNLPLGTVRLMETYGIEGSIGEAAAAELRRHILAVLGSTLPERPDLAGEAAVACGGNAEALARIAPGPRVRGIPTINLRLLRDQLWQILNLGVAGRMKVFNVRRDRAEVMGLAAITFVALARWANLDRLLVPGVGVREGAVRDLALKHFGAAPAAREDDASLRMLAAAREFAARLHWNEAHSEQVRRLALSLFDQLRPLHRQAAETRLLLELGALLHDVGHVVSRKAHHKHGEYLVRYGPLPGLKGWRRAMVACLVRYHNRKAEPDAHHKLYASLDPVRRRRLRELTALLRIAEGLGEQHGGVADVDVELDDREAVFRIRADGNASLGLAALQRKASLFEREFRLRAVFKRAPARRKVA